MPSISILARSRPLIHTPSIFKSISTLPPHPQDPPPPLVAELPPNPASGSPFYNQNWRNPYANAPAALMPIGMVHPPPMVQLQMDATSLMDMFADRMTSQRWDEVKQLFELWIRSLDRNGKPNKPDVGLYNHYLRANFMVGAAPGELLELVNQMEEYGIVPNTASFNLVLKAMHVAKDTNAAQGLIERMLLTGKENKESLPDETSYDLVIGMLFLTNQIDGALKYIDLSLKSGYVLSMNAFTDCVRSCAKQGRLDLLLSIIERCKKMDENKALCPPWAMCNYIADIAMHADNADLAFYALESMAKWIARGEHDRPILLLSVNEGLAISALATAGRTSSSKLLDGSWAILNRSLRQKKPPTPESYLGKIYAHASLGSLPKAFNALREFESIYGNSAEETSPDLLSPFTCLNPLVLACSKNGFPTLDLVYYQLENLSKADPPYKSVAALNCVILGCANIWDVDRAYQTFSAIDSAFGLSPNIHSYNALISAFVKFGKTEEALKVVDHFVTLGLKPNATTYSLLVDGHLTKRDAIAAISTVDDMVSAGYEPSEVTLKKIRRRCIREMDDKTDGRVTSHARRCNIRMGSENRRNLLFRLEYSSDYPPNRVGSPPSESLGSPPSESLVSPPSESLDSGQ